MQSNTKGALLALLAFGIFSTHDVLIKFLGGSYSAFQIVFFSVLFGFPISTLMLMNDKTDGNLRPRHPWWTALRTISAVIAGVSGFYAFSMLPMAQVYAILFTSPLLITLLSIPILGETVGIRRGMAIIVGLLGVLIVLRPGSTDLGLGHAAALVSAVGGALASIIVRKIGRDERSVVLILYPMMANVILMGVMMAFVYRPMPAVHFGASAMIAALAFIATLTIIAAYRAGQAVVVAPMQYSQILWATAYGLIFFDELLDPNTAIGASVIIASGIYIVLREDRSNASENTPVLRTRSRFDAGTYLRVSSLLGRAKNGEKKA
ncbi:DMT family transporter [Tropicimonas isoalkanivorans]|uniref:Permease of the drug/metabolite transporter (DMT) superfamily n=1 Tax=Tropicimonas isoalkanivorans TaxID=441112 RepID=A0A1I1MU44_9RHOB|nr:DMT family transporter [Tropicimonas isoalkanivorans]SFC85100.1 Permease of the drug/metabolite transporter (DMT) superfamily [Tropicimonas isoalkanivorans]